MGKVSELAYLAVTHPHELRTLLNYKIWYDPSRNITDPSEHATSGWDRESMRECWRFLDLTSRSFSAVIKELEGDLARVVCIFYLVLRALDTVEDDMSVPNSIKLPLLRDFHKKLYEPGWTFDGSGPNEKDREVLQKFESIGEEFRRLDEGYQTVIATVTQRMGAGMAEFAALATPEMPVAEVSSIDNYNLYCHYVAGLVGEGLSGLFSASGKERSWLAGQLTLSNSMGLLLQKTNILRDIKEDVDEGRGFWPRAIWSKYGFNSMKEIVDPAREADGLWALSEMTLDAMRHLTDALDYLTLLKCQSVFNFVAIPAVMAIATLERCFMNPEVLKRNVKIRKGEAVKLMMGATNPRDVAYTFRHYAHLIHAKVHKDDPNKLKLSIMCGKVEAWTEHHYPSFVNLQGTKGNVQTMIDTTSGDARADLFLKLAKAEQSRNAEIKKQEFMDSLVKKGLIKNDPEEQARWIAQREQRDKDNEIPMWQLVAVIGAALALFIILGAGVAGVVYYYSE